MAAARNYRRSLGAKPPHYAAEFITAAGIVDSGQQQALHRLETDLVAAGLLDRYTRSHSLLKAYYPLVGGTAFSHQVNFADPAAFPLEFANSPTHSATGVGFNGVNQFAVTHLAPAQHLPGATSHLGYYARTPESVNRTPMGADQANEAYFRLRYAAGGPNAAMIFGDLSPNTNYAGYASGSLPDSKGFLLGVRESESAIALYSKGVLLQRKATTPQTDLGKPVYNVALGCLQNGSGQSEFSDAECAGACIGLGLSESQATALYAAMQRFNTTLNRAV